MRIVGITAVKNESDIIESFVRHTLAYTCRLVVLDNGSTDGTLDILRALVDEGLPLDILEDPTPGQFQSRRMTRLMRDHALGRLHADWILPLDADELVATDEASLVHDSADPARPIAIPWREYVPDPSDDPAQVNPVVRMGNRLVTGCGAQIVLVPRRLAALPDAELPQGHHQLNVAGRPVESGRGSAYLGHFPIRSPGQFLAKMAITRLQYQTMGNRHPDWGFHYREPFELLKRDPEAFLASFHTAALSYMRLPGAEKDTRTVAAPFPYRGGPLRYTAARGDVNFGWRAILDYAESLAVQFAVLSAGDREVLATGAGLVATLRAEVDRQVLLRQKCEAEKEHVIQEQQAFLKYQEQLLLEYKAELQDARKHQERIVSEHEAELQVARRHQERLPREYEAKLQNRSPGSPLLRRSLRHLASKLLRGLAVKC